LLSELLSSADFSSLFIYFQFLSVFQTNLLAFLAASPVVKTLEFFCGRMNHQAPQLDKLYQRKGQRFYRNISLSCLESATVTTVFVLWLMVVVCGTCMLPLTGLDKIFLQGWLPWMQHHAAALGDSYGWLYNSGILGKKK